MRTLYFVMACLVWGVAMAEDAAVPSQSLPQPLTLDYALSLVDGDNPEMMMAQARIQAGEANLAQEQGADGVQIDAQGKIRWIGRTVSPGTTTADHSLGLTLSKRIYDFGSSRAAAQAAEAQLQSYRLQYLTARAQRHLLIMRLYFDVLLADINDQRDYMIMSKDYVQLDKMRKAAELGQESQFNISQKEVEYQKALVQWRTSENMQRISRARLALALNRPDSLPGDLIRPKLKTHKRTLPDYDVLRKLALEHNPELLSLRQQLKASEALVLQARRQGMPSVDAQVAANSYTCPTCNREDWSVGVIISMPIWDGGQNKARISKAEADYYQIKAQLRLREMQIAQSVLELWADLQQLKAKRDEAWANSDYREMYLDRSRTMYRQQLTTDLGDAMIESTNAEIQLMQNDFSFALAWAQMDALTGKLFKDGATQPQGDKK